MVGVSYFLGTLVVPLFIPIDDFFGLPSGSTTVLSWFALAISEKSSGDFNFKRKMLGQEQTEESIWQELGLNLFWTLVLILGIVTVKAIFTA